MNKSFVLLTLSLLTKNITLSQINYNYPQTTKESVADNYFGTLVKDPYRWLEDDKSPRTNDWVKKENIVTENYLKQIISRDKIKNRLTELWNFNKQSAPFKKGDFYFCYKNNGLQNQNVLFIQKTLEDVGQILLDPNSL